MSQIASILLILSLGLAIAVPASGGHGTQAIWAPLAPSEGLAPSLEPRFLRSDRATHASSSSDRARFRANGGA